MFNPKISVIVPCYNYGNFLPDCLNSLTKQTYLNFEVIIVDDGSTDNSAEIAKQFVKADKRFVYIYQRNQHLSVARNTGIKNSNGDYICFVDPDDIWFENKLEVQIDYFKHNQDCGLLYSDAELYENGKPTNKTVRNGNYFYHGFVYEKMLMNNGVVCPSVMVKRECFDKCGDFVEGLKNSQDWEMWLRIAREFKFCSISKPLLYYRIHENNNSKNNIPLIYHIKKTILGDNLKYLNSKTQKIKILDNNYKKIFSLALSNNELILAFRIYFDLIQIYPLKNLLFIRRILKRLINGK